MKKYPLQGAAGEPTKGRYTRRAASKVKEHKEAKHGKLRFGPLRVVCNETPQATAAYVDDTAIQHATQVEMVIDGNSEVFYATVKARCASFAVHGEAEIYNAFRKKSGEIIRVGKPETRYVNIFTQSESTSSVVVADSDGEPISRVQRVTFRADVFKGVRIEIDVFSRSEFLGEHLDIEKGEEHPYLTVFARGEIERFVRSTGAPPHPSDLKDLAERTCEPYEDLLSYAMKVYEEVTRDKDVLCCSGCKNPLRKTESGGYNCDVCGYSPSMQDTFTRKARQEPEDKEDVPKLVDPNVKQVKDKLILEIPVSRGVNVKDIEDKVRRLVGDVTSSKNEQ